MIYTINHGMYYNEALSLKKAINNYRDEYFTGLTSDDKKEINDHINVYLKNRPLKTPQDRIALDNYIQSLQQKYGFKGNSDFASMFVKALRDEGGYSNTLNKTEQSNEADTETDYDVYAKFVEGLPIVMPKITTEYDGARYNANRLRAEA